MKRIIVIIVLSICLLGTAGWGISTRHEVSLLENNIRELSNTIAQQARTITGQETTIADQKARIAVQENIITDQISTITIQLGTIKALGDSNRQKDLMIEGLTFSLGKDMLVVPRDSPGFDCDDSALYMYEYFTSLHYTVRIVKGNLDMTGETLAQCNHVWVWVTAPTGGEIAYDWGKVFTDEQHRVGYVISYKDLLMAALSDY